MTYKKLKILTIPNRKLFKTSKEVTEMNDETRTLVNNMLYTMQECNGIGLAAIQVGVEQRILVLDRDLILGLRNQEDSIFDSNYLCVINPVILKQSEELFSYNEGCLSIPDVFDEVSRPCHIKLQYQDINMDTQILEASDLLSICIQHEIDHLNGIVFIHHLAKVKYFNILKKFKK